MEHGPKAAKAFVNLIKQTLPKDGKPGKNRSLIVAKTPAQPVLLVSPKKSANALSELKTMSKSLGIFTPIAVGQVVFEKGEVHLKLLKPATEAIVRAAFLDYFKRYKVNPPSQKVKLIQPDEWDAVEFEESPHDEADEAEAAGDEDDTDEEAAGEDDDSDEDEDEESEAGSDDRAGALSARIDTETAQLKKIAGLLAAHPEIRPALLKATTSLTDARKQLGAKALDEVETLLHAAQAAMTEVAHLIKGGAGPIETGEEDEDEEDEAPPQLKAPTKPLLPIWVEAKEAADAEIGKLQEKLRASGDEDLEQIAEYGLYGATTGQAVKLMAALRDADNSKSPDALKKLYVAVNSYADYMDGAGSEMFDLIEQNEFHGVPLRKILGPALNAITKELGA
ncbi:MAG TPA: hypothetical protein VG328_10270 [Stellaceae bacterium]|jgi:hypothetical protein|nr:hypothetical protein [Stellaceae bacterium]